MQRYSPEMNEGFRTGAIYADMVEDEDGKYYLAEDVHAVLPKRIPSELRHLRVALKSGDYNGAELMAAWIVLEELADLLDRFADNGTEGQSNER